MPFFQLETVSSFTFGNNPESVFLLGANLTSGNDFGNFEGLIFFFYFLFCLLLSLFLGIVEMPCSGVMLVV